MVEHLQARLQQTPAWQTIALFLPLPSEPDLTSLLGAVPARNYVFPRVVGDDMQFHHVTNISEQTTAGPWGLREPLASCPAIGIAEIDLMLCPGMAFARHGVRLGKGGGFYDRYLAASTNQPYLIGITFDACLFDSLPHEEHDVIMNEVLTEKGFVDQNGASSSLQ